jgi:predicted phage terminase large subunit-like protein
MQAVANQPEVLWRPNPGPQTRFLASRADECLYGGAAGGGKSAASIALPLRWTHHPRFRALFLRREAKYLRDAIDKSDALYPRLGARRNQTTNTWTFPSGAQVWLNHCEHESDVRNYDSLEFHLVIFEELTHFTERQYLGIRARIRGTDPELPRQTRATCNPGGEGHEWVFKRFAAWLDPAAPATAAHGQPLHFVGTDAQPVPAGTPDALSRTFIGAKLTDNPHITPEYRAQLMQLDAVRRAQLLDGDWLKKAAPKDFWDRAQVTHWDHAPAIVTARARCWDLGATEKGDWTVGTLMSRTPQGVIAVEHVLRFRGKPDKVHAEFRRVAYEDKAADPRTEQWLPLDPGQAGIDQVRAYQNEYPGITIRFRRPTGDKLTRFRTASARAPAGNLVVVRGSWNGDLHDELESAPQQVHDDQMDTISDGVAVLTGALGAEWDQATADEFAVIVRRE